MFDLRRVTTLFVFSAFSILVFSGCSGGIVTKDNPSLETCFANADATNVTQDGNVERDRAWWDSYRHIFGTQTASESGAMQARRQNEFLYLSFEVERDPQPNQHDYILVAFEPSDDPTEATLMKISPFPSTASSGSSGSVETDETSEFKLWEGDGWESQSHTDIQWGTNAGSSNIPSSLAIDYSVGGGGGNPYNWEVEMKIPISEFDLPESGEFGFYANVAVLDNLTSSVNAQLSWPDGAKLLSPAGIATLPSDVPPLNEWGTGSTDSSTPCEGVYFTSNDLYVNNNPNNKINPSTSNQFHLKMYNKGSQDAVVESGKFSSRDRGAGSNYTPVAEEDQAKTVTANQTQSPTILDSETVPASAFGGQSTLTGCMQAEVDSDDPNTTFAVQGVRHNIGVQSTNSPFQDTMFVDLGGSEVPSGQDEHEVLLTTHGLNTSPDQDWEAEVQGAEQINENQYRVMVDPEDPLPLYWTVEPPAVDIPSETYQLEPGTGKNGKGAQINVNEGEIITLIVEGQLRVGGSAGEVGPFGESIDQELLEALGADRGESEPTTRSDDTVTGPTDSLSFPVDIEMPDVSGPEGMRDEMLVPLNRRGMVVASLDGFDSHYDITGTHMTTKIPEGVEELSLAINDFSSGYELHEGEGFQVQVVRTLSEDKFADKSSLLKRSYSIEKPTMARNMIPFGANLPTYVVCARRKTGDILRVDDREFAIYEDIGCVSTVLRSID